MFYVDYVSVHFQALTELGVSQGSFVIKNLENSLMWAARACAIKVSVGYRADTKTGGDVLQDLVMMLSFSIGRNQTESQKKLFTEVTTSLERRWVEIKGG